MTARRTHDLSWGAIRASINSAREVFAPFGRAPTATADVSRMLQRWNVRVVLEDLPDSLAAVLTPVVFRRRQLLLSRSVPVESRQVVLLHEAGHLMQGTASLGVTYDNTDWRSPAEQMADLFVAAARLPTSLVDRWLRETIWLQEIEQEMTAVLREFAEGIWGEERALTVARNRLVMREKLGL